MAKEPKSLRGKVVAITGGARGIGRSTAEALVREGAKVAIGDLDTELAEKTATEIGSGTIALELDVTRRDSFESFLDQVEERLGSLDVLVNNAGIMPLGRFAEEDDATARRMVDINVHGVLFGMKAALPRMERRNSGHIVNIASQAGKGGFPGGATYCATKFAVVGVSEAVRAELFETEIEISCVMPAVVNTELASGLVETRAVKPIEPEDVAADIVDALKHPRFDVYVPKSAGRIAKAMQFLPRGGREAVARFLKADQVLAGADVSQRADYEDRAAHSEPGLEPGKEDQAEAGAASESREPAGSSATK
jgi:NADP-dependent 3-hydroxy acid dehydrogenase YdfG